ncbi:MAG: membrane protein insertion efficiency factor YidD [Planctomycetota bacterium]
MKRLLWPLNTLASILLIAMVWVYRYTLGVFMGGQCRYHPTCSQYMLDAVAKYGPWRGGYRGVKRILRCHPWGGHGDDPA